MEAAGRQARHLRARRRDALQLEPALRVALLACLRFRRPPIAVGEVVQPVAHDLNGAQEIGGRGIRRLLCEPLLRLPPKALGPERQQRFVVRNEVRDASRFVDEREGRVQFLPNQMQRLRHRPHARQHEPRQPKRQYLEEELTPFGCGNRKRVHPAALEAEEIFEHGDAVQLREDLAADAVRREAAHQQLAGVDAYLLVAQHVRERLRLLQHHGLGAIGATAEVAGDQDRTFRGYRRTRGADLFVQSPHPCAQLELPAARLVSSGRLGAADGCIMW